MPEPLVPDLRDVREAVDAAQVTNAPNGSSRATVPSRSSPGLSVGEQHRALSCSAPLSSCLRETTRRRAPLRPW